MEARALVGRDRELAALDAALATSTLGRRALLMVSGEPGIGKTRLLEELATRVAAHGGRVAWGRMWEVGLTPAFWPFIQVLAALQTPDEPAPSLDSLSERSDASARLARFTEVAHFIQRRSQQQPLAILLDDLHKADRSSLQLLEYLAPLLLHSRVLLALAARDVDAAPEVAAALGRIQRGAQRLVLGPLDISAVGALVAGRADAQRVFELSEGNPLFVEELLSAADAGASSLQLPRLSSVRAVIRERLAALPLGAAEALQAASVLGREFAAHVVELMTGRTDVSAQLSPVRATGMLTMTAPDRYRFSHVLVAETIADELDPSERARLHLRAAQALERYTGRDSSAVAHHLLAAGHQAAEAAVGAAERAARTCSAQFAFEDAAALLESALQALALVAPEAVLRRCELQCQRAEALQHAGRHEEAAALCDGAAHALRELPEFEGDAAVVLLARLALVRGLEFRFGHTDSLLVSRLREALDKLGEAQPALRAKLLARLAAAEQPARDPRQPLARALEAIALAQQLTAADRMDVMYVASSALVEYMEPSALEPIQEEVLALASGRDRSIAVHTRLRLCFIALDRADRAGYDRAFGAFALEANALGLPRWTRQLHMLRALTALLEGRFDDAQHAACAFEASLVAPGDVSSRFTLDVHRLLFAWVTTRPVEAALVERIGVYAPGRAPIAAWLAVQAGDAVRARAALAELAGEVPLDPDLGAMVAIAIAYVADAGLAERALLALRARSGRVVLASMVGCAVMDVYDRLLLLLAATAQRWDEIDEYAQRGLTLALRLGSPLWVAHMRAAWADALDARARSGDRERARAERALALAEAERLGMPGLVRRCQSAAVGGAAAVGSAVPAQLVGGHGSQQLQLERSGGLWVLRGFGEELHLKSSRGLMLLARLIEAPGQELHVLELMGAAQSAAVSGDAGPLLDQRARAQYRERMRELSAQCDEAREAADLGRLERAQAELDQLTAELERAFGLGGRERRAGSASERARSNVQRRIAHALSQVREASPRLGEQLAASVRTGTYCVYAPTPSVGAR